MQLSLVYYMCHRIRMRLRMIKSVAVAAVVCLLYLCATAFVPCVSGVCV